MGDRAEMEGLLERVKAATGPDREIDGDIYCLMGGDDWKRTYLRVQEPCGCPHEMAVSAAKECAPRYTASIDAAVGLVGRLYPGNDWQMGAGGWCTLILAGAPATDCTGIPGYDGSGANTPLAICVALLVALLAQSEGER